MSRPPGRPLPVPDLTVIVVVLAPLVLASSLSLIVVPYALASRWIYALASVALLLVTGALAILYRRAVARLQQTRAGLTALERIVQDAACEPSVHDLLPHVLSGAMRAVGATSGCIALVEHGLMLRVAAASPERAGEMVFSVGEGVVGKAAQTRQSMFVEDVRADPSVRATDPTVSGGALLAVPVRVGALVLGVIAIAWPSRGRIRAAHRDFIHVLAGCLGCTLDNARLVEEARQSNERLGTLVHDLRATQAHLVRGETMRTIGQLSSGMAHHLNNLFTVILARVQLLLGKVESEEVQRALAIVKQAALDGAEVVRRVQRFGQVEPLSMPVPIDLNQIVKEVVELVRPRWQDEAQRRGVTIDVSVEAGEIPAIAGEPAAVREAVMNVLLNAIDALADGGRITVKTSMAGASVRCAITDTGIGMSEDVRHQALEPFFTTKGPKRTGLGLSVAFGIVERHGGSLAIESAEGVGTTVMLTLPVVTEMPVHHASAPTIPAAPASPLRLLVVDDELEVRLALADILEARGHQVVLASSGREALALLELGERVDVVLTDLGMPGMNGSEMAKAIKGRWAHLPVGLVTGWAETGNGDRAAVDFVVSKPFDAEELDRVLRSAATASGARG